MLKLLNGYSAQVSIINNSGPFMTVIILNRPWVFRWHWVLINLSVITLLLFLAQWQWQRAIQKQKVLHLISQWQAQPAASLGDLVEGGAGNDGRRVEFPARWVSPYIWLMDNQILKGKPGYDVVIPVQKNTDSYESETELHSTIVLLNLGWLAAPLSRNELPEVNVPREFIVDGIYRSQVSGIVLGKNAENSGTWPMRIQQIRNDILADSFPDVIPGAIYQQKNSPFTIHYSPVVLPPERHKAYALQWLLLAIAALLVGVACARSGDALRTPANENTGEKK
jgi:surfeit locus 1 family protein